MSFGDEHINPLLSNSAGGGYRGLGEYGDLCDRHPDIVKRIHSFDREGEVGSYYVTSFILKNYEEISFGSRDLNRLLFVQTELYKIYTG